jgi:hypothetical protein
MRFTTKNSFGLAIFLFSILAAGPAMAQEVVPLWPDMAKGAAIQENVPALGGEIIRN